MPHVSQLRLLSLSTRIVQAFRIANVAIAVFFLAILCATLPGLELVQGALARKYGGAVDTATVVLFVRVTLLLGLPICWVVERLLAALRAILGTVADGDPFVRANAARLRTIGWMLLTIQVADLAFGATRLVAKLLHIDYASWQPSFTGWLGVLIAFVLAQVFERGAAMREDLDGTV